MSDAAELVEELAERLAKPAKPQPKYIVTHPNANRAMRRGLMKQIRRRERALETWKRRLIAAGINWEDVLVERRKRAEKEKRG
jgi:hypothetical protein